jgi:CRP/FNR family cyclic AMP-dependent transcriptional regulator
VSWLTLLTGAGYVAALLTLAAFFMVDTIRLRQIALASNVFYAAWAFGTHLWPTLLLHLALFPLNIVRLTQLVREKRLIERALATTEVHARWLTPFMNRRRFAAGTTLFRRGDPADCMYFLAEGRLRLEELALTLQPGALIGEIGIFSPAGTRTQTVHAVDDTIAYVLRRDEVLSLYRRDPAFGIYLVRLITSRLVEDLAMAQHARADVTVEPPRPADGSDPMVAG